VLTLSFAAEISSEAQKGQLTTLPIPPPALGAAVVGGGLGPRPGHI
jgi:hypothetical protein